MQTQSPASANPQSRNPLSFPPYVPPANPEEVTREQDRVRTLLEINSLLLEHVNHLQSEGKGGSSPIQPAQPVAPGEQPKTATIEYTNCMRVVQYNCGWLAIACGNYQTNKGRSTIGPMVMDSPINNAGLLERYKALKELFPGWNPRIYQGRSNTTGTPPSAGTQGSSPTQSQMQAQLRAPSQIQGSPQVQMNHQNNLPQAGLSGVANNQPH